MSLEIYYASLPEGVREIKGFEISHSDLSQTYKFTDDTQDLSTTDNGTFTKERILYDEQLDGGNLDKTGTISINDFGDVIDAELDNIPVDSTEPVVVKRYKYLSNDLSAYQDVVEFEARTITQSDGVATLQLAAPRLNIVTTGDRFNFNDVPMLRGV